MNLQLLIYGIHVEDQDKSDESAYRGSQKKRRGFFSLGQQSGKSERSDPHCQQHGHHHRAGPKGPLPPSNPTHAGANLLCVHGCRYRDRLPGFRLRHGTSRLCVSIRDVLLWERKAESQRCFQVLNPCRFVRQENSFVTPSQSSTYKFTIDKYLDLGYGCACYLEKTSPTPPATPPLTLDPSIACSLFALSFQLPSFVFNRLQPLSPKHPGWGALCGKLFRLDFVRQKKYCSTAKSPVRPQLPSLEVCP